jgi:hypothetical protein
MANYVYPFIDLIGGGTGALDAIDGAALADKDMAYGSVAGLTYTYLLDADSAAAEASPGIIAPNANGGDKRWILQGVAPYATAAEILTGTEAAKAIAPDQLATALFALQGDIPYASANLTPNKLAKGAADLKMFMNAGATAPEWAAGVFANRISIDMATVSGNQAYTGIGFKPAMLIFFACNSGAVYGACWGFSIGTATAANINMYDSYPSAGNSYTTTQGGCIYIYDDAGKTYAGIVKSQDADGYTITWTKTGTPAGTLESLVIAIR